MASDEDFALVKQWSSADELHEVVATYYAVRPRPDGQVHDVRIEVLDGRDTVPSAYRWSLRVTDLDTGKQTHGNGGASLKEALAMEHWAEIDSD